MLAFDSRTGRLMISPNMAGLLLCTEGNAELLINGTKHKFSRGTLCIISPLVSIEKGSSSDDCKWEMICDEKDIFHSVSVHIFEVITKNNIFKNPCLQLDEKWINEFMFFENKIKYWKRMLNGNEKQDDFAIFRHNITVLEQAAGMEFISLYFQKQACLPHSMSRNENVAYDFINTLNHNYYMQHNVGWYAEQAKLSPNYFSRIVRLHTGYPPTEWIKKTIIANAKLFLARPKISIKQVAAKLNFSDQVTFCKYFKNCTGMSPSQYREMMIG